MLNLPTRHRLARSHQPAESNRPLKADSPNLPTPFIYSAIKLNEAPPVGGEAVSIPLRLGR